jgi:hypothetical protein
LSTGAGNRNVRTKNYRERLEHLPVHIQRLAQLAFERFVENPTDPVLDNHPLNDTHRGRHRKGSRAVAITQRYRAIYVVDADVNVWYWVGSHEDYNNFTGKK